MKTIFVCDGNWYLHRAFSTNKSSRPLADVLPYSLASMVCKDALLVRADYLMVAFDGPKNFRKDLYPEYKANRDQKVGNGDEYGPGSSSPKDQMYSTLPQIFERFIEFGIPFYQPRKHEADDVGASIAWAHMDQYRIRIGTQDKDSYQLLVRPTVKLMDSSRAKPDKPAQFIDRAVAEAKKGVQVERMIDYQTLIGDRGDNIQPVPGIGPARARQIIDRYPSLKAWIESGDDADLVAKYKEHMRLNRKLVTLAKTALPPGSVEEWKLSKVKSKDKYLTKNYHELHNYQWPKTRGLFG